MVTSPDLRHVPTSRLAFLAQRIGAVFVSASTLCRLVRVRGWRRPRFRIHPEQPTMGIRATKPNELWHIDTTVIRLLNHMRIYLHAVIDNFSRRILAWTIADRFDTGNALAVLVQAGRQTVGTTITPTVMADAGVENKNAAVDELIRSGVLTRVLAQTEIHYSNSLIEAWWRSLKHGWLFLHELESLPQVRSLVAFHVEEHNARIPHSAFDGQTPDEMYFGTGGEIPHRLAAASENARAARLAENRARRCAVCA
jgi:transposase InsO family protein